MGGSTESGAIVENCPTHGEQIYRYQQALDAYVCGRCLRSSREPFADPTWGQIMGKEIRSAYPEVGFSELYRKWNSLSEQYDELFEQCAASDARWVEAEAENRANFHALSTLRAQLTELTANPYDEHGYCTFCGKGPRGRHDSECAWADVRESLADAWDVGWAAGGAFGGGALASENPYRGEGRAL